MFSYDSLSLWPYLYYIIINSTRMALRFTTYYLYSSVNESRNSTYIPIDAAKS